MKPLLCILGTLYVLGALNAIRKRKKVAAVYQLFWALAVAGVLLFSGCSTVMDIMDIFDDDEPRTATVTLDDGTTYEAVEVQK